MKKWKKLVSLVLTLVMVLAMTTTVFAEETGEGSITINNAVDGQTYTIYRIFDLESYVAGVDENDKGAYAYQVNAAWKTFIEQDTIKGTYVNVDEMGYVTWVGDADAATFAETALAYAKANGIQPVKSVTAANNQANFIELILGYYLVDSTVGFLCNLDTTNPNVTAEEKNGTPDNKKTVQEDRDNKYGKRNDGDFQQTVNFQSKITAQKGAVNYVFHDKMSEGLTFVQVTEITLNGIVVKAVDDNEVVNYEVVKTPTDGDTFDVKFAETFTAGLDYNDEIVISYTAVINESAVVDGEGNPNTSKLSYGDDNNNKMETPEDETRTYTWDFKVYKYTGTLDSEGKGGTPLKNAKFVLYKKENDVVKYATVSKNDNENVYKITGWADTKTDDMKLVSGEDGKFTILGLDSDTYYLEETDAPTGYNRLQNPVTVIIDENGNVKETVDGGALADDTVNVQNNTGAELPSTGGIGTTIFYVLGAVLMLGAAVLLITKRRMRAN